MQSLIDILGSIFMGAAVILIVTNLNIQMMNRAKEQVQINGSLYKSVGLSETLQYDLYKIGYKDSSSAKIIEADSSKLKFRADIDNNTSIDSVTYTVSSSPVLTATNEYAVYRQINNSAATLVAYVTECKFIYFDSLGTDISYGSLSSAVHRARIKTLQVNTTTRSETGAGTSSTDYQSTVWNKKFRPKNL